MGQPYTKSADMWSAGVVLYAMVAGELPFEGVTMEELGRLIAYEEPAYHRSMSPELVDLLKKLLQKDPASRATIEKVKVHPWFSQNEYSDLMSLQFGNDQQWTGNGVCRDIIEKIGGYGMDVKTLPHAVINGEYNPETAVYFMLRRQDVTDKINEVMREVHRNGRARQQAALKMGTLGPTILARRRISEQCSIEKTLNVEMMGKKEGHVLPRPKIPVPGKAAGAGDVQRKMMYFQPRRQSQAMARVGGIIENE